MSFRARLVLQAIADGEDALQRLGGPLPDEQARIMAGDHTAITRRLEPSFYPGQRLVLSWSRPRKSVITHPRIRGDAHPRFLGVSKPEPQPAVEMLVTEVIRRSKGGWSVRYQVFDRRHRERLPRRQPPARDSEQLREDAEKMAEWEQHGFAGEDIEEARLDGAYTTDPSAALDTLAAVPDEDLDRFSVEAATRFARGKVSEPLELRLAAVRAEAKEKGVDISQIDASIERRIKAAERRVRAKGQAA